MHPDKHSFENRVPALSKLDDDYDSKNIGNDDDYDNNNN
jgi:hypothetical protein